jgi:hypothetical protein
LGGLQDHGNFIDKNRICYSLPVSNASDTDCLGRFHQSPGENGIFHELQPAGGEGARFDQLDRNGSATGVKARAKAPPQLQYTEIGNTLPA